jgi:threonine/homoserine/homoserine lactone efflux protein
VAILGALYFGALSLSAARESRRLWHASGVASTSTSWSFARGVLGNLLNPLSWVFWVATGTPTMLRVYRGSGWAGLAVFTVVWFGVAMGGEVVLAASIAVTRRAVGTQALAVLQAASAMAFLVLAGVLLTSRPG